MLKLMLFGPLLAFGILSELGICQELRAFNDNDAETIIIERNNIDSTNENEYDESFKFLKKLSGLEAIHLNYSEKYLYSLVNS